MESKSFTAIRIRGHLEETGVWMGGPTKYVDMLISEEEAKRIVKFLTFCLEKKDAT